MSLQANLSGNIGDPLPNLMRIGNPPQPPRPAPAAPAAKTINSIAASLAPTVNAGAPVEVAAFDEGGVNCILSSDASVGAITPTGITRYKSLGAFRRAQASAPAADTRQEPEEEPREVNRHVAGDMTYVMFSDGAVEVRNADGAQRFASLQALREAAAAQWT